MRVLGVIPSRYQSSRFPGKPLIDLKGKSMIQRVFEGSAASDKIQEVVVATDDVRIFDHVVGFGGKAMMTSTSHRSGTDRCGEVIQHFLDYDIVINIQGDEPLVDARQLEQIIHLFDDPKVQIATLAKKIDRSEDIFNPNRVKVVLDKDSNGIYFSRNPIPYCQNTDNEEWLSKSDYYRHIGIYAYRTSCLKKLVQLDPTDLEKTESLEQLRWLYNGFQIRVGVTAIETPNIDTPDDVKEVLKFLDA